MLLGYREKPSANAGPQTWTCAVIHQRRCSVASSERWPMARLRHLMTDRDRQRADDAGTKAWLVSLACDIGEGTRLSGQLWTTRLRPPSGRPFYCDRQSGHEGLDRLAQGTVCKLLGQAGNQGAQGALLSGTPRRGFRPLQSHHVRRVYGEVSGPDKHQPGRTGRYKLVAIVSTTRSLYPAAARTDATDLLASASSACELRAGLF